MEKKTLTGFPLKRISLAVLAGVSFAHLQAWSNDFEELSDCQQVKKESDDSILSRALGDELEILSWNIQKTSNQNWQQDLARLGDSAHLILFQEAVHKADFSQAIPVETHNEFAPGYRRGDLQTGVMTVSASSPTVACDLSINEPWLRTPKATSIAQYRLENREEHLLVVNLHAVNFSLGMKSYQSQLSALDEYLESHPGPIILAGDLNTWSKKRLAFVNEFTGRHGLNPVVFEPDHRSKVFGKALDHVYVRGMEAHFAEAIQVDSSDHNPLRVKLRLL